MHFSTIYLMRNEELDNVNNDGIIEDFYKRFCYGCGENTPKYEYFCDWFALGGRWLDILNASKGYKGETSWTNKDNEPSNDEHYSVCEIKDLISEINENSVYAIATKSKIYRQEENKFKELLDKINTKKIKGVIALMDCHD